MFPRRFFTDVTRQLNLEVILRKREKERKIHCRSVDGISKFSVSWFSWRHVSIFGRRCANLFTLLRAIPLSLTLLKRDKYRSPRRMGSTKQLPRNAGTSIPRLSVRRRHPKTWHFLYFLQATKLFSSRRYAYARIKIDVNRSMIKLQITNFCLLHRTKVISYRWRLSNR